ncbi:hypothetical protein [Xanthobacter sp. YC-JY1]|uniref:hypothetical protein n=1 Tax=Xanthobacter sp. YC-JY1 TaxID=2419844 RepID=UPI001F197FA4|nr:hypothetical protein [Xanthobacter sp. YC-JY1]UJX45750.1 hypothetical protein D7006_14245 [Xanthobacter sp. YC-JY1]
MPYALKLDAAVSDTTLPILYPDAGMSPGTLFLFDAAHSQSGLTAGVVPTSGTFTNIARDTAAAALGKSASLLDWTVEYVRSAGDTSFKVERTAKGGIHAVSSQVGQAAGADYWRITPLADLRQGLLDAVPGSALFAINWYIITRLGITTGNGAPQSMMHMVNSSSSTANFLYFTYFDRFNPSAIGFMRGPTALGPANTPAMTYVGASAWTNSKPASLATFYVTPAILGRETAWAGFNQNKSPSLILYRSKIEDLSKTKRANNGAGGTFAEEAAAALAVEQALFTSAFASGGKFYGDTWSDPAVLLP